METFSIRDLHKRTGDLIRNAKAGHLSVVAQHGHPLFVAVPFDDKLLESGVKVALACRLFQDRLLSAGKAAKFAGLSIELFIKQLGTLGIPVVDYPVEALDSELEILAKWSRLSQIVGHSLIAFAPINRLSLLKSVAGTIVGCTGKGVR